MRPTEELRAEHEGILVMLRILERVSGQLTSPGSVELKHLDQILDFLRVFVDRCHHGKEEDILFPALERTGIPRRGGPIGVMLSEHEAGRGHIRDMGEALDGLHKGLDAAAPRFTGASARYIELLKHHIEKENNVLFPMADRILPEQEQVRISEELDKLEKERIGEGRHEAFHRLMDDLARIHLG